MHAEFRQGSQVEVRGPRHVSWCGWDMGAAHCLATVTSYDRVALSVRIIFAKSPGSTQPSATDVDERFVRPVPPAVDHATYKKGSIVDVRLCNEDGERMPFWLECIVHGCLEGGGVEVLNIHDGSLLRVTDLTRVRPSVVWLGRGDCFRFMSEPNPRTFSLPSGPPRAPRRAVQVTMNGATFVGEMQDGVEGSSAPTVGWITRPEPETNSVCEIVGDCACDVLFGGLGCMKSTTGLYTGHFVSDAPSGVCRFGDSLGGHGFGTVVNGLVVGPFQWNFNPANPYNFLRFTGRWHICAEMEGAVPLMDGLGHLEGRAFDYHGAMYAGAPERSFPPSTASDLPPCHPCACKGRATTLTVRVSRPFSGRGAPSPPSSGAPSHPTRMGAPGPRECSTAHASSPLATSSSPRTSPWTASSPRENASWCCATTVGR